MRRVLLWNACLLMVAACVMPAAASAARIYDIRTATEVRGGRAVGVSDRFADDTEAVHVWFRHEGIPDGGRVKAAFFWLAGGAQLVGEAEFEVRHPSDWGDAWIAPQAGVRWPPGPYRVDLLVDGRMAGSTRFAIEAGAPPSGPARIIGAVAAQAVEDGRPQGTASVFSPGSGTIHVWFRFENVPVGSRLHADWLYLEAEPPRTLDQVSVIVPQSSDWADFSYSPEGDGGWPEGRYRVAIQVDGRSLENVDFRVGRRRLGGGTGRIAEIKTARSVAFGRPVDVTDSFPPDTRAIYAWFRYEQLPPGAIVRAEWTYLELDPPEVFLEQSFTVGKPSDVGYLEIEYASGQPWPRGAYRLDLLTGGQRLARIGYRVESADSQRATPVFRSRHGYTLAVPPGWREEPDPSVDYQLLNEAEKLIVDFDVVEGPGGSNEEFFRQLRRSFEQQAEQDVQQQLPMRLREAGLDAEMFVLLPRRADATMAVVVLAVPLAGQGSEAFLIVRGFTPFERPGVRPDIVGASARGVYFAGQATSHLVGLLAGLRTSR